MTAKDAPCKGCTERFTACSDRCPKDARGEYGYKAWKAECQKIKDAYNEYKRNRYADYLMSEQCDDARLKFAAQKHRRIIRRK